MAVLLFVVPAHDSFLCVGLVSCVFRKVICVPLICLLCMTIVGVHFRGRTDTSIMLCIQYGTALPRNTDITIILHRSDAGQFLVASSPSPFRLEIGSTLGKDPRPVCLCFDCLFDLHGFQGKEKVYFQEDPRDTGGVYDGDDKGHWLFLRPDSKLVGMHHSPVIGMEVRACTSCTRARKSFSCVLI